MRKENIPAGTLLYVKAGDGTQLVRLAFYTDTTFDNYFASEFLERGHSYSILFLEDYDFTQAKSTFVKILFTSHSGERKVGYVANWALNIVLSFGNYQCPPV